jgi:hypothetical protein
MHRYVSAPFVLAGLVALGGACAVRASTTGRTGPAEASTAGRGGDLVGVWRVVRFCGTVDSLGHATFPYGPAPTGYFIYTASGQLSIQVMRTPAAPRFAADTAPTDAELRRLHDSNFGYFGTYTVTSDSTVIHHVLGGTIPAYIGTDQPRPYWISGPKRDSLSIGSRPGRACRLLVRLASG